MVIFWYGLIALVVAVRFVELGVAKRNRAWAMERGGVESGAEHYPVMVGLHTALFAGCLLEVPLADRPFLPWLGWPMLALVVASQALRWWCITTLGHQWNTRVIVVPGLPLVHTAWITALAFTVLNALLLRVRLRVENEALATAPAS